tara:strand:+ start:8234 stop:9574 length:1341 start_codon:yes stop_codon:yes gene_type:complete
MTTLLGLTTTTDLAAHQSQNARRKVFYSFPNGGAPMTGLLSMADTEASDKVEWGWYEGREENMRIETGRIGSAGPFSAEGNDTAFTTQALAHGTVYRCVTEANGTNKLLVGHTIWIKGVPLSGAGTTDLYGVVTEIMTTAKFKFQLEQGAATIDNQVGDWAASVSVGVHIIGSAMAEGSHSPSSLYRLPELSTNYMQIFKTAWDSTGSSLQEGMKWSDSGHYADKAWQSMRRHANELEAACLWGMKTNRDVVDPIDSRTKPRRTTKGIYNFLRDWDTAASATTDADPNKRIIDNAAGTIAQKDYNRYMDRLFEQTNDKNFMKICFCGNGHLTTLTEMWEGRVQVNTEMIGDEKMKFVINTVTTPAGTVGFHTHPMFSQNPDFKYSGLYLDVNNLAVVPLNNRNTILQENIQPNNADYIEHQYLTEAGLEMQFPDSHMMIHNLQEVA